LYLTAEDGLADTIKPRLEGAGADCSRVHALMGKRNLETGKIIPITSIGMDYIYIENAIGNYRPVLVVVDPLQAYLGAIDMHRANEVRPVLAKLATLAERYNCAILLIRHLGKSQQDRAIYRGLGSIDFVAAARSVLMIGQEPDAPAKRAVIQTKNSLAPIGPAIGYEIQEDKFYWTGISELTASEALRPERLESDSKLDQAGKFLLDALAGGPKPVSDLKETAEAAGISFVTLKRAKQRLPMIEYYKLSSTPYYRIKEMH
jgi:hypothetical protein